MRVLFIGGTGIISTACTQLAAQRGIDLTLATRGRRAAELPAGVTTLTLDMDDANGATQITLAVNSWAKSYTAVDRMRQGKKVIVPGDGSSLWVITHNTDFAKG